MSPRRRIVVAMSGGVDSSVAAALLVREGHDVIGVSMRLWNGDAEHTSGCCSLDDFLDARRVADRLGVPFYVMDFQEEFRRTVVDHFVREYAAGRTPNPCARCNQFVKFGSLRETARALGAEAIATGHYARVERDFEGEWRLLRGVDEGKDQSYFLFAIPREELATTLFPVGEMRKPAVRALAAELGFPVADKADSQEVCFAPGRMHSAFVVEQLGRESPGPGAILAADGSFVGTHAGVHTVTIGQRRGLGVGGGEKRYVTQIDAATATVRIGGEEELATRELKAAGVNWLLPKAPAAGRQYMLKIRSRHSGVRVRLAESTERSFRVEALDALRAVTPGQAAVLYEDDRLVGGGWIQ